MNSAVARCAVAPWPDEPKLRRPGCAPANAMSSFTDFAGTEGWTSTTNVSRVNRPTGAKSFTGWYGSFGLRLGVIANPPELPTVSV